MSLAKVTGAALLAVLMSACAHGQGASPARASCADTRAHGTSQRTVVLADQGSAMSTDKSACAPAPLKCDVFASSPHPWCDTQPWGL